MTGDASQLLVPKTLMAILMESEGVASCLSNERVTETSARVWQGTKIKIDSTNSRIIFFILPILSR
jgi:hypothetical protein